ncbi:MAG: NADP-dependent malic enzyme [Clostridia bacterium]|jgi:malate dehydrogenase (oxaloacetate-decarboxylating)|nr:NADP-dependent malic enzyme [Clostridia bacterium]
MDYKKIAMEKHAEWAGKIEVVSRAKVENVDDLSIAYTPGVAEPCLAIKENPELSYTLTRRHNMVAVITDGSAVLGLGNIGPIAGMPVMEGKCVLFKEFGNVDAFPICVDSQDVDEFVNAVALISKSFGGINLEDIGAPRCFEIEQKLKERCDIPVFHDDQHGTAVVVLSGIRNALKLTGKKPEECSVVMSGAGAAGTAIAKLLLTAGFKDITMRNIDGVISSEKTYDDPSLTELASLTNPNHKDGSLADIIKGADIFIGVSAPGLLTEEMIKTMNKDAIIFAMANPVPEVMPEIALAAGARVIATGRSDYPNQINNVLAFPGIFRGALDVRASDINDEMMLAASDAISKLVTEEDLANGIIIPSAFNKGVVESIAKAVADAAVKSGVARI